MLKRESCTMLLCPEDASTTVKHEVGSIMLSITLSLLENVERFKGGECKALYVSNSDIFLVS